MPFDRAPAARRCAALLLPLLVLPPAIAQRQPHAGMMRYPDVSATHIVFSYAEDLWRVPREGGLAIPLASPPGAESFPRFSPDGKQVAFVGNYDGNRDIYIIPVDGGVPFRVTHHPAAETICDWSPDGTQLLFFASGYEGLARMSNLYLVREQGGLPARLPVPYGAVGALSADATWLAYTPHTADARTWKRYRGGMATDIWLFNLKDHSSKRITNWEGTDSQPMWHGQKLYYMSDAGPSHKLNIWTYDPKSEQREQVTKFEEFDIKWPSIGPGPKGQGEIVFQYGPDLYLLDLQTHKSHAVEVIVPGDRPMIRPQRLAVSNRIDSYDISPTGQRGIFEARGDIWTVPARKGSPRNLTRTSGAAERMPGWSPDGRWIAYFSDETGEYELYLVQSDGRGTRRQLTFSDTAPQQAVDAAPQRPPADKPKDRPGDKPGDKPADKPGKPGEPSAKKLAAAYRFNTIWSPDSKYILFTDKGGTLYIHTLANVSSDAKPAGDDPNAAADSTGSATQPADTQPVRRRGAPEPGETLAIDTDPWASQPQVTWSHDANWLAYTRTNDNRQSCIYLYSLVTGEKTQVTSGMFNDSWPAFDRKGDYLYFASNRRFEEPVYEDVGSSFVYTNTDVLVLVPLRSDVVSPWAPKSDEEEWKDESGENKKGEKPEEKDKPGEDNKKPDQKDERGDRPERRRRHELTLAEPNEPNEAAPSPTTQPATAPAADAKAEKDKKKPAKPLEIELEDFEQRAIQLPVPAGGFTGLVVNHDGKLLYVRQGGRRRGGGGEGDGPSIKIFDPKDEEKQEKTVLDGVGGFAWSMEGKKLLVRKGGQFAIIDAAAGQKMDKPMSLDGMIAEISPREEWRQVFLEAWRLQRDFFYVPNMHGVDWPGMRDRYLKMLEDCVSRADVSYIIRELISELNVGHAYYWGSDGGEREPSMSVGLLGCDFELADNAYRIKTILCGAPWDLDAKGPLSQPGVAAQVGDYVLAVNGVTIDPRRDPWSAFQGLAGKTVTLIVSDQPELDPNQPPPRSKDDDKKADEELDAAARKSKRLSGQREIVVTLLSDESELRYRAWVEKNRRFVEEQTGGQVGYVHVPDTGLNGQNELFRQFYGQRDKAALIIDERWNGGGQIPHRFIELLNRPPTNYWARRDGKDWPSPADAHFVPKCMLINGLAGSGGDAFPYYFRQAGLGKLIGTRTWGGLVGISGNPNLIDGATVTVPTFGFFAMDGRWAIEGHGVDPDIEVLDDPAKMWDGGDPQLSSAIELMQAEVRRNGYKPPQRPVPPNRAGMGWPDAAR